MNREQVLMRGEQAFVGLPGGVDRKLGKHSSDLAR
jgi:hypothetical protein